MDLSNLQFTKKTCIIQRFYQFPKPLDTLTHFVVDSWGIIYMIIEHSIWKLEKNCFELYAGTNEAGDAVGDRLNSQFRSPQCLVLDDQQQVLYVCDQGYKIKKITLKDAQVIEFVGSMRGNQDGNTTEARFYNLQSIAIDKNGNIYVIDHTSFYDYEIKKITPDGNVKSIFSRPQREDLPPMVLIMDSAKNILYNIQESMISVFPLADDAFTFKIVNAPNHKILQAGFGLNPHSMVCITIDEANGAQRFGTKVHAVSNHRICVVRYDPITERFLSVRVVNDTLQTVSSLKSYFGGALRMTSQASADKTGALYFLTKTGIVCLRDTMAWNIVRLLWIAKMKEDAVDCQIAKLPKDVLRVLIAYLRP